MVGNKRDLYWWIRNIILWIIVLIMAYPFLYMISVSLSEDIYVLQNKVTFYPMGFNLNVYKTILTNPKIYIAYKNTIVYTAVGTFIALIVTTAAAYALSKKRCPLGKPINIMVMITMFFSGGMVPCFLAITWLHLYNTMWAITLPGAFSAWNVIIMRSFFTQFPTEIEESGKLDGLNDIGILWYLVLPTSTAVLATIGLFVAVGVWNSFFYPLIYLQDDNKMPLQILLRSLITMGQAMASSGDQAGNTPNIPQQSMQFGTIFVSIIPIIAVYPWLQKYFVKGVMVGSVKG